MTEKRGQHEIEKMKEVVDPKKKREGRRKKRAEIHKHTAEDVQVKRRIESTASETFKEKSKDKF